MTKIFISYRRDDSAGYTGRLYDHILQHFEESKVFRDVDTIKPGEDFVVAIEKVVGECDALIAVIGPKWLEVRDQNGNRRLNNLEDYVRLEIATALKRNIIVIPVLIERAGMPNKNDLPEDLSNLTRRNAIELSHDRFSYDVDRIIQAIGGACGRIMVRIALPMHHYSLLEELLEVYDGHMLIKWLKIPKRMSFLAGNEPLDPIYLKVKEGVHNISVVYKMGITSPGIRSNELSIRIKGGQTQPVTVLIPELSPTQKRVIIKPY